jgi:hypothetical protein
MKSDEQKIQEIWNLYELIEDFVYDRAGGNQRERSARAEPVLAGLRGRLGKLGYRVENEQLIPPGKKLDPVEGIIDDNENPQDSNTVEKTEPKGLDTDRAPNTIVSKSPESEEAAQQDKTEEGEENDETLKKHARKGRKAE